MKRRHLALNSTCLLAGLIVLAVLNATLGQDYASRAVWEAPPPERDQATRSEPARGLEARRPLAPFVRTYEKIVLAGSEVRLACPHATSPTEAPGASSFATVLQSWDSKQQQQRKQLASSRRTPEGLANPDGEERIRWFRNHVPLPANVATPPDQQSVPALNESNVAPSGPATMRLGRLEETTAPQFRPSSGRPDDSRRLSPASEFNQAPARPPDTNDEADAATGIQRPAELKGRMKIHRPPLKGLNANELGRRKQQTGDDKSVERAAGLANNELNNGPASGPGRLWYVSEFGELVLERVAKAASGSYTCLHGGQLSEVLLDVLDEREEQRNETGALNEAGDPDPIEMQPHDLDKSRPSRQTDTAGQRTSMQGGAEPSEPSPAERRWRIASRLRKSLGSHHKAPQPQQAHLVESELVAEQDLEAIPGIIYTKQRLHCPAPGRAVLREVLREQVQALVARSCLPASSGQRASDEPNSPRCVDLANRLVAQLLALSELRGPCSGSAIDRPAGHHSSQDAVQFCAHAGGRAARYLEVVWFKDGSRLHFNSNGRGLDTRLNVKLIDSADPSRPVPLPPDNENGASEAVPSAGQFDVKAGGRASSSAVLREQNRQQKLRRRGRPEYPLTGLILEIDGVRRPNEGRYTCALRLNEAKLRSRLARLGLDGESPFPLNRKSLCKSGRFDCLAGKNDKSKCCCDGETSAAAARHEGAKREERARTRNAQASTPEPGSSLRAVRGPVTNNKDNEPPNGHASGKGASRDKFATLQEHLEGRQQASGAAESSLVSRQIKALEFILNETISSDDADDEQARYIAQTISSPQPAVMLQTFLLLISERSANSSSLWATIREANEAYSRRKLTDFMRLKRGLMKPLDVAVAGAGAGAGGDLNNPDANFGRHRRRRASAKNRQQIDDEAVPLNGDDDGKLVASLSWLAGDDDGASGRTNSGQSDGGADRQARGDSSGQGASNQARAAQPPRLTSEHKFDSSSSSSSETRTESSTGARRQADDGASLREAATDYRDELPELPARPPGGGPGRGPSYVEIRPGDKQTGIGGGGKASAQLQATPFNYANERNLKRHLGLSERRGTIASSFDLHPETFDSASWTVADDRARSAATTKRTNSAHSGSAAARSQRVDEAANSPPRGASGHSKWEADERAETTAAQRLTVESSWGMRAIGTLDRNSSWRQKRENQVEADNSNCADAHPKRQLVIDGAVAAGRGPRGTSNEFDEKQNEVGQRRRRTNVGGRPDLQDGAGDSTLDCSRSDQTNSCSPPAVEGSAREFVTEKSNIRMGRPSEGERRKQRKFNNVASQEAAQAKSARKRPDGDDFIKFAPASERHNQQQAILDDQSGVSLGLAARRLARGGSLEDDNDDDTWPREGARKRRRRSASAEGKHKLQPSKAEQRRRFGPSDKSALSGQSDPLRRLRRRALLSVGEGEPMNALNQADPVGQQLDRIKGHGSGGQSHDGDRISWIDETNASDHLQDDEEEDDDEEDERLGAEIVASPGDQISAAKPDRRVAAVTNVADDRLIGPSNDQQAAPASALGQTTTTVNGLEDDESLLWTASQYLYMHMRAFSSSSLYGVQVDVEWSNEREPTVNRTGDLHSEQTFRRKQSGAPESSDSLASQEEPDASLEPAAQPRSFAPFATIELVSGQSLHLQCTAQALGRLPEAKWYKRVDGLPDDMPAELRESLARSVGQNTFWPVTSLDLLGEESEHRASNLVCSQSITIFDNLLNQTFTVVSTLKLSQYHGRFLMSDRARQDQDHLFACFVDADVRHDYATLGVHLRRAPGEIPMELSKRLRARSLLDGPRSTLSSSSGSSSIPSDPLRPLPIEVQLRPRGLSSYDLLRQSEMMVPFKSVWIPIKKNDTNLEPEDYLLLNSYDAAFSMTPIMLVSVIALLASSLIALVYLTMRSYRVLSSFNSNGDYLPCENEEHPAIVYEAPSDLEVDPCPAELIDVDTGLGVSASYCEFNAKKNYTVHRANQSVEDGGSLLLDETSVTSKLQHSISSVLVPFSEQKFKTSSIGTSSVSLYEAHFHEASDQFICDQLPSSLFADIIPADLKHSLNCRSFIGGFDIVHEEPNRMQVLDCCANGTRPVGGGVVDQVEMWHDCGQTKINMVVNPINHQGEF